jgi:hypothetical protein
MITVFSLPLYLLPAPFAAEGGEAFGNDMIGNSLQGDPFHRGYQVSVPTFSSFFDGCVRADGIKLSSWSFSTEMQISEPHFSA